MAFAKRYPRRVLSFAPPSRRRTSRGPGALGSATPGPMGGRRGRRQTSQVPGEPCGRFAWVFDPGGTDMPGPNGVPTRPPLCSTTRAPDEKFLSRLHVQAFRLTVYASPSGSPRPDARLASGCWPALPGGICTRRVPTEGFRVVVVTSLPPSPGFAWRNEHRTCWRNLTSTVTTSCSAEFGAHGLWRCTGSSGVATPEVLCTPGTVGDYRARRLGILTPMILEI
jgi:hypothetical protein